FAVPVAGDHRRSVCLRRGKIRASWLRCPAAVARCAQGGRPGRVYGDPRLVGGGAAPGVADCAPASGPGLRAASWGGRGDGALGRDRPDGTQSDTRPRRCPPAGMDARSEEHTSELQSRFDLVCRLLLEKKNKKTTSVAE